MPTATPVAPSDNAPPKSMLSCPTSLALGNRFLNSGSSSNFLRPEGVGGYRLAIWANPYLTEFMVGVAEVAAS